MTTDPRDLLSSGVVSNCCGAPIYLGDICTACKEHCEPVSEDGDEAPAHITLYVPVNKRTGIRALPHASMTAASIWVIRQDNENDWSIELIQA